MIYAEAAEVILARVRPECRAARSIDVPEHQPISIDANTYVTRIVVCGMVPLVKIPQHFSAIDDLQFHDSFLSLGVVLAVRPLLC